MYPGFAGAGMAWTMVLWFVISVAIIALFVVLIQRLAGPSSVETHVARRILDERLARGEIDPQEYQSRRALIG